MTHKATGAFLYAGSGALGFEAASRGAGKVLLVESDAAAVACLRDAARELEGFDFLALRSQLGVFLDLGIDVFVPLWIGGLIVGALAAGITYPLTLRAVVRLRKRRRRRRRGSMRRKPRPESRSPDPGRSA